MASYHRVLEAFDRYTNDNDLQCDTDVHPWHIRINGERWSGKIRLIGFIDVFFLISYTGTSRFEKGIIIYKDEDDLIDVQTASGKKRSPEEREKDRLARELEFVKKKKALKEKERQRRMSLKHQNTGLQSIEETGSAEPTNSMLVLSTDAQKDIATTSVSAVEEKQTTYFDQDSLVFKVSSNGHEIGLKTKYSRSAIKPYHIELRKPSDPLQSRRIMRSLRKHDPIDLLEDSMNVGIVSGWEVTGHALGHVTGGGVIESSKKKFNAGINAQSRSKGVMMEAER